jgi:DNA-directed RNA polymerase subunit RPC12/RpoP
MIDNKVKIKCSKCSMMFRERAHRIRNDFQMQCPNCFKLITFDSGSEDTNIRRALSLARKLRTGTEPPRGNIAEHEV